MTIASSQRYGYVLIVVILIALYAGRDVITGALSLRERTHPHADARWGSTVVELSGDTDKKGIYYIPSKTSIRGFLQMAGVGKIESVRKDDFNRILVSGMNLNLCREGPGKVTLATGRMENAKRLALDMPMDLNAATVEDLARIDGIGGQTAEMIVEKRSKMGGFKSSDDLMDVKGIGMKKHERLKRYFYIESRR